MKRWWFWALLISTFVRGSVFFAPEDKFGRIKEGMTKEQILTIIGSDPKDKYTSDPTDNRNIRVDRGPSVGIIRRPDPEIEEAISANAWQSPGCAGCPGCVTAPRNPFEGHGPPNPISAGHRKHRHPPLASSRDLTQSALQEDQLRAISAKSEAAKDSGGLATPFDGVAIFPGILNVSRVMFQVQGILAASFGDLISRPAGLGPRDFGRHRQARFCRRLETPHPVSPQPRRVRRRLDSRL